jgi:hypothetical protein
MGIWNDMNLRVTGQKADIGRLLTLIKGDTLTTDGGSALCKYHYEGNALTLELSAKGPLWKLRDELASLFPNLEVIELEYNEG